LKTHESNSQYFAKIEKDESKVTHGPERYSDDNIGVANTRADQIYDMASNCYNHGVASNAGAKTIKGDGSLRRLFRPAFGEILFAQSER
jgi:hypothetical protein